MVFNTRLVFVALSLVMQSGLSLQAQEKVKPESLMRFGSPSTSIVEGERGKLELINPTAGRIAQSLWVYTTKQEKEEGRFYPTYLIVHEIEKADETGKLNTSFSYPAIRPKPLYRVIWDPKFSPNGRYVLFKYGVSTSFDVPYAIFVFDTETQELRQITQQEVSYHQISWSPDGNYIAFIEGGDALGNTTVVRGDGVWNIGPLRLTVCNWRTGQKYVVATNNSLRGPLEWAPPHNLIYGKLEEDASKSQAKGASKIDKSPVFVISDIYSYSVETRKSELLFKNGFRPTPSQSGTWIAFFGAETLEAALPLKKDWNDFPSGVALSVAKRDGSERLALNQEDNVYPFVVWLPDDKHLLTLKQTQFGKEGRAQVKEWDIATGKFRVVAELTAKDFKSIPRSAADPQFLPLKLSSDGQHLIVAVSEAVSRDPLLASGVLILSKTTIQSIDLNSGEIQSIAQSIGDSGVDWHE